MLDTRYHKPKFGRWLLDQATRGDDVGLLAQAANQDRQFPREGDVQAVSRHLNAAQAGGEMHMALEDACLDYAAL